MAKPIKAAQYVRMSTEHQQYSTENQADIIREYAEKHGFEIVRTFADAGKSGLRIQGRDALRELIDLVKAGAADFETILVYDVSRWGRFQDADESAYYEYSCKRAGITVHYCAEQFANDGTVGSTIIKTVKRAMAGEYSRELSAKVFKGQCRLIELGYRQGGAAGFGLRRMLVDHTGTQKGVLQRGEQKSIQTDRVVLVPGPSEEVDTVQAMYRMFIEDRRTESRIASHLNTLGGFQWSRGTVHEVLTNEKYIGHNVFNRVSFKLKVKRVENPPDMWVRDNEAFEPIVNPRDYYTVQGILKERNRRLPDGELLERLKELLRRTGRLSATLIDESEAGPSSSAYRQRFGSLLEAYAAIDYLPAESLESLETNRRLRRLHPETIGRIKEAIEALGGRVRQDRRTDLITINEFISASIVLARAHQTARGSLRWEVRFDEGLMPDLTVAVRMDARNQAPLDYFLFPALDVSPGVVRLTEDNGVFVDAFRFDDLEFFCGIAEEVPIEEAA